ncbi:DUF2637 domain-containing protein (plasmid) [Streptomyces sp. NBC_01456]|uniref:DUF2637 domain-containing protein n=1 Tax=unclassified Streptomyces TaxID=2593676 RepID=UPI002E343277|nr:MULTISPECIES: DUF2637 domain-containing protein [unclassified Streptomyces]
MLSSTASPESSELAPETVACVRAGLVVGLVAVAGVAFVVSWTALHDVGRAIGLDAVGAVLYPLSADGPIALALVASLVLAGRHRRAALTVLVLYTFASLALNYVHGLVPLEGTRPRLSPVPQVHWVLVGVAAALPVGSIACCADLVTRVLRSARPATVVTVEPQVEPVDTPVDAPVDTPRRRWWGWKDASAPAAPQPDAEPAPASVRPLVAICGGSGRLYRPEFPAVTAPAPPVEPEPEYQPEPEPVGGLSAEEAAAVIEQCWREGVLSLRKTAELAGRSKSLVEKQFAALVEERGPRPEPQQMTLQGVAA